MKACIVSLCLGALCEALADRQVRGGSAALRLDREATSRSNGEVGAPANAEYSLPVPEVQHNKTAGKGYTKGSPLYRMQEEFRSINIGVGTPPVSTTMHCIINLACQYTLVYVAFFIVETLNKFKEYDKPLARLEKVLGGTKETVHFCPMLCVLFLATRMRAVQLSQRETEKYGLPPGWVQWSMILVTVAVFFLTPFAIVYTYATSQKFEVHEQAQASLQKSSRMALGFLVARYVIMSLIYVGFTAVCMGLIFMPAPTEVWGDDGGPPVSATMICIMILCCLFFGVHLAHTISHTLNEFRSQPMRFGHGINTLQFATECVQFAPMLCVLMLAVRMRALQINPYNGSPQTWAQVCFYLCTAMIVLQTILVLLAVVVDTPAKKDDWDQVCYYGPQDSQALGEKKTSNKVLEGVRLASMFIMYCGIVAILISASVIEHPDGPDKTPAISPTMRNVQFLTTYYFLVQGALWVVVTVRKYTHFCMELVDFLWGPTRDSVSFCPILCILFIGLRMRALQMTNNKGAPQHWAQIMMYFASFSCPAQAFARVDVLLDRVMQRPLPTQARLLCIVLRYISLSVMYICGVGVVIALFIITPETAIGTGSTIPEKERIVPPDAFF